MRSKIIPCIHFSIIDRNIEIGQKYTEYELLQIRQSIINTEYDYVLSAYSDLTQQGWIPSVMGNSVDFYKDSIKTLEELEILVSKNNFRKLYGNNFTLINQLFIFNDTMKKQELLNSLVDKPVSMVVFSTPTCGPCRAMKPKIEAIASDYNVVRINAHEDAELSSDFDINAVPTMIFFKHDKEYSRNLGIMTEEEMKKELDKVVD